MIVGNIDSPSRWGNGEKVDGMESFRIVFLAKIESYRKILSEGIFQKIHFDTTGFVQNRIF
jgi:hypothetical protein